MVVVALEKHRHSFASDLKRTEKPCSCARPASAASGTKCCAKTLPDNTSLAEQQVFTAFDKWSQESGATVTGITPQWKNDSTNYMTLNCRVEASGDLGTLSRFVYDIEQNTMALKLDSVEFSAHDNTGQQLTLGLQLSGLALTTLKK